jgi:hypothetical protein
MKSTKWTFGHWILLGALVVPLCSCSMFRGRGGDVDERAVSVEAEAEQADDLEAALRTLVAKHVKSQDGNRAQVIRRRPYYLKEYAEYPDGHEKCRLVIEEKDSRTAPRVADVKLQKVLFVTDHHRKKAEARTDEAFRRDTGMETLTYELRNGRWMKIGSLFVAAECEVQKDGEWVPLVTVLAEELPIDKKDSRGWFGRAFSRITGR